MRWLQLIPVLLLPSLLACSSMEQRARDAQLEALTAACQAQLEQIHDEGGFPGATLSLVLADGRTISLAVGVTEEGGRPLTPKDRMLVGSTGKTWVAAIVHKLVEQGKLNYDDLAVKWFENDEWFLRIPNAPQVTLRQLLRHQSGLERYEMKPEFWQELMLDPQRIWEPQELLAFVFDDTPMFAPGQGWAYADTNYILLGMIIERVTGRSFYELASSWINTPLSLNDTIPSDQLHLPGVVQGTVMMGRQLGVGPFAQQNDLFTYNVQFEWCGGGFASTASDLAWWARQYGSGDWFEPQTRSAMLDAAPARELGPGSSYGLGVMISETRLGPFQGHDGFMPGYLTAMGYFPEHGVAAAIQVNTDDGRSVGMPLHEVLVRLTEVVL